MEYGLDNRSVKQNIGYMLAKLRERGMRHCLKRSAQEICRFGVSNLAGMIAYPFCAVTNTKFVPLYVRSIGHLCREADCYIKEEALGARPRYNSIVLAGRGTVANAHMLDYWKSYGIKTITSPVLCALLGPLSKNRFTGYDISKYVFDYRSDFPRIQKMYRGRPPLLKLTDIDIERGRKTLEKAGVPREAWFVCVHCREDSYLGNVDQSNRSCDINNYFPAMKEIVKRGGWIIRMGDPKMKAIPRMENVIDYAHMDIKSDRMDVFLAASCRFFLGSNSGLQCVATVFGVRGAAANYSPISTVLPYGVDDIAIPKLAWSVEKERYLTFPELFDSPASNYRLDSSFSAAGVKLIENSPEDVTALTLEMLDITENKASYTAEDETRQARFKSLMNPSHYSYGAVSRVGRDFLRKYEHLLDRTKGT
ncbi:MAG: TIGR04372 family glycosyltransferase [Candidatus Omnitrophica bacterium]|nr:TIGR04372 family glycosyltransferase [Candidatus Omnitrophota bacterium]